MEPCSVLQQLPVDLVERVLSHLPWQERVSAANVIPRWKVALRSPVTWRMVSLTINADMDIQEKLRLCLEKFGYHVQHISLTYDHILPDKSCLQNKHLTNFVLHWANMFCKNLRQLSFMIVGDDPQHINKLLQSTDGISRFTIHYHNTQKYYIDDPVLNKRVTKLCLSNSQMKYLPRSGELLSVIRAQSYPNIVRLTCPIHYLSTSILMYLGRMSLRWLRVSNDDITADVDFNEPASVSWTAVAEHCPDLWVDYTISCRTICSDDFPQNPLMRSLTLDSLCVPLTEELVVIIVELYGASLERLILCDLSDYGWGNSLKEDVSDEMFRTIAQICDNLRYLAIGFHLPPQCIIPVTESRKLSELVVLGDENTEMELIMSERLGYRWYFASKLQFNNKIMHLMYHIPCM